MNTTAAAINRKIDAINRKANPVGGFDLEMSDQRDGETRVFDSAYKVGKADVDPGWFVWGKWGGSSAGVWKRIAWPEGPRRKWPKISRLVQPGFRTKAEAESAMREIESMYPSAKRNPTPKRAPRTVALLARKSNPAGDGGVSLAIGVNAGNDRNGNPRRGWIILRVWDDKGRAGIARTGFVEEGYSGDTELRRLAGEIPTVDYFDVSVSEFNRLRKGMGR